MTAPDAAALWCCRHRWTLRYILVVLTLVLALQVLEIRGVL